MNKLTLTLVNVIQEPGVYQTFGSPNPELDRLAVKFIVEYVAEKNSPITYSALAQRVGPVLGWKQGSGNQAFAGTIGRIQGYCLHLGLPTSSVMVVDESFKPKLSGFIPMYCELYPEAADLSDNEVIRNEQQGVLKCRNWRSLYDYVGLETLAPVMRDRLAESEAEGMLGEGKRIQRKISVEIARNAEARKRCLAAKGCRYIVCERTSEEYCGIPGIIHVHHLDPLADSLGIRPVDSIADLVPICPNCHTAIHSRKKPCYTPNELREMIGKPPLERY